MGPIRVRAKVETDGELRLTGLPLHKGEEAEIIILTDGSTTQDILALLRHDPAWAWLLDPAEDIYDESDVR